jgi:chaperonin GroES
MKIRPLHDRVVVRRKEQEETTAGGIILTAAAKEKPNQGVVVAVGPGAALENGDTRAMSVSVGDEVVFGRYADSNTIKDGSDELIIMSESEIYGIVEA